MCTPDLSEKKICEGIPFLLIEPGFL
jgi:hypothetical protein